jgi:hypothetical protein
VPVVLLDPGLNGTTSLTNVDLTTFTGDAVDARYFQARVILERPKETGDLPGQEAYSFYVMSHYHPADAVEYKSHKRYEGHQCLFFSRCVLPARWIESMMNLPVTVAILCEHTTKEFQFAGEMLQMALALHTKIESKECLLVAWWCDSTFRYRLVWVGFLYTLCPEEPSGLLHMSISRKGRWMFNSVSMVGG